MKSRDQHSNLTIARLMAYGMENKKALDPIILDISQLSSLADYFIIGSGKTEVQVRAITQEIERVCEDEGLTIYHLAGKDDWSWVVIDLGDVMVHVMKEEERHYYKLEDFWQAARKVSLPPL